ncbi:Hypothetical predicted protein [Octopus vulgaris]|uniref:ZMYM2-like/QRICH1 C-terminal domain-containing protein n=1 Tax=Octopus vulgaris TaxID=6645 RepID=A0AA36FMD1_OCTVU|nr:Hypothetical predicted protein [Octopus vulgaris]
MENLPRRAESLSDDDINKLWECDQLGPNTPESIFNTLWWNNTVHFGIRSVKPHNDMRYKVGLSSCGMTSFTVTHCDVTDVKSSCIHARFNTMLKNTLRNAKQLYEMNAQKIFNQKIDKSRSLAC